MQVDFREQYNTNNILKQDFYLISTEHAYRVTSMSYQELLKYKFTEWKC